MDIRELKESDIKAALEYIDKNEVPSKNKIKKYYFIVNKKSYPTSYVLGVACALKDRTAKDKTDIFTGVLNKGDINTKDFNSSDAKTVLRKLGYEIKENNDAMNDVEMTNSNSAEKPSAKDESSASSTNYLNPYSRKLLVSKNIIFRGAPGTGKSYLAKQIAADIVSGGKTQNYKELTAEQKQQVEFVQFHPSYDYSDFVEGLRPRTNEDGTMGFELEPGIFKKFVKQAIDNYENSQKSVNTLKKELSVQEALENFLSSIELGVTQFETLQNTKFIIENVDEKHIDIFVPSNEKSNRIRLNIDNIGKMLESKQEFEKIKDVTAFFGRKFPTQADSYMYVIYNELKDRSIDASNTKVTQEELKTYIFIIDEINRGEISKIFGELFFSIDPGYRGKAGEISTQYSNLHSDPNDKFYIPENVYIIGTMNDIDRSVDSFDFAMRRRFRFIELTPKSQAGMLSSLEEKETDAKNRMTNLNNAIIGVEGLNSNYQIGPAYFLKLNELSTDELWEDYLEPLLHEYVQGINDEDKTIEKLEKAYGYEKKPSEGNVNENTQDQG